MLEGSIPNAKMMLLQVWIEIHREELEIHWQPAVSGLDMDHSLL